MDKISLIYARVSTSDQSLASQMPDLDHWMGNCPNPVQLISDKFSGKSMKRPGWSKAQDLINRGKVGELVVWRLDRLGRTASGLTALFEELQSRNINLVSLKDGIDLSTAAGRLMANVLASVSAYETEVRGERVRAGQAAARAQGKTWGGSEKGRRIRLTEEAEQVIHSMHNGGSRITSIARATGLSRRTVKRVIDSNRPLDQIMLAYLRNAISNATRNIATNRWLVVSRSLSLT